MSKICEYPGRPCKSQYRDRPSRAGRSSRRRYASGSRQCARRAKLEANPSVRQPERLGAVQPKPDDYDYELDDALASVVGIKSIVPERRLHRRDARHGARGQRRAHSRRRPRAHHRLPHHRGRDGMDQPQRRPRRSRPRAGLRPGDRASAWCRRWPASTCRPCRWAAPRTPRSASVSSSAAPAAGSAPWPRASSPSRSSPAIGSMCSMRRSSPRPRTPTGAARR